MNQYRVTKTRLFEGIWEGVITAETKNAPEPTIAVTHQEKAIGNVKVYAANDNGQWNLRFPIPPEKIADGVQTFLIRDAGSGETLDSVSIISGEPLADDIRAEVELLRAELDMLKRAFRRHCIESM